MAQRTSPEAIKSQERAIQALQLRKAGLQYEEIASQLGYNSAQAAHKAVSSLLKRNARDAAEDLKQLILSRREDLIFAVWRKATNGNLLAIDRVDKQLTAIARLFGLEVKTLSHKFVDVTKLTDEELDAIIESED